MSVKTKLLSIIAAGLMALSPSLARDPRDVYVQELPKSKNISVVITTWPNHRIKFDERYFLTEDLGKTWKRVVESDAYEDLLQIRPTPDDPSTLYKLLIYPLIDSRTIIEKSFDGGNSWQRISARVKGTSESLTFYQFLTFHPMDPSTLYVRGNIIGEENPDKPESVGVYISKDKGETFTYLFAGLQSFKFRISRSHPETMYAIVYGDTLIKSDNSGKIWGSPRLFVDDWIKDVFIDPTDHQKVYVHCEHAIFRTADGGYSWKRLPSPGREVLSLALASKGNETAIFAGINGNLFVSRNEGSSWLKLDLANDHNLQQIKNK